MKKKQTKTALISLHQGNPDNVLVHVFPEFIPKVQPYCEQQFPTYFCCLLLFFHLNWALYIEFKMKKQSLDLQLAEGGVVQNSLETSLQCHILSHIGLDPKCIVLNYFKNHSLHSFDLKHDFLLFLISFFFFSFLFCLVFWMHDFSGWRPLLEQTGCLLSLMARRQRELPAMTPISHLQLFCLLVGAVETGDRCGPDMIEEHLLCLITT